MTDTELKLIAWRQKICNGNLEAEDFCKMWMLYCHQIDDLLDTREDGRPTLGAEFMLGLLANAIFIYNHPFYIKHRQVLQSAALTITNIYADSVIFERAPEPEKRAIADVIRCGGNEMYFLVAMICGGWKLMREISPQVRHLSWLCQHDDGPKPF